MLRKRRTRSHIIADLSVNHVERHVLLCGYTVERNAYDYGIDMEMTTYNANGEVENGKIYFQLKATDAPRLSTVGLSVVFVLDRADIDYWLGETYPVILIVYNVGTEIAYWLHIQAHFGSQRDFAAAQTSQTVTTRIPLSNIVDVLAMRNFADLRDGVLRQL